MEAFAFRDERMKIVAGLYKNRPLVAPKIQAVRPTSSRLREAFFNICQPYIENANFLDLFAGSGAMGLEALSRGASHATFVDSNKESIRCIKKNLQTLGVEGDVYFGDVFAFLKKRPAPFDIIFSDPPYEKLAYSQRVLEQVDQGSLLKSEGRLFIEDAHGVIKDDLPLETLTLESSRRVGRSELKEYRKR